MASLGPTWSFADAAAPLFAACGDRLTLMRDGDVVRWEYDGRTVTVGARADGTLDAAFVDRPSVDEVSSEAVSAVYRSASISPYRMSPEGATRMAADMLAFFQDVREPRFRFVSTHAA